MRVALLACFLLLSVAAHASATTHTTSPLAPLCPVAVGNSWIASCLRDLGATSDCVHLIVPPGSCPGHYDLRPSQLALLRASRVTVFFDFQASMAERLRATALTECRLIILAPKGGLCVPDTYRAMAHELASELARGDSTLSASLEKRLRELDANLEDLARALREQVKNSPWASAPVLASVHQKAFCEWLGLRVVATIPAADTATPAQVERILAQARAERVRAVVANRQEGTKAAEAMAASLNVPVVEFSNFPDEATSEPDFAALVRQNVTRLVRAAERLR